MTTLGNVEAAGELAHALVAFVDAAKVHAQGLFWRDPKMQGDGCAGVRRAALTIETLTGSRDLLLPLLRHAEPGVRLNACLMSIDDHYGKVIPVLQDLDVNCVTEVSSCAGVILQMYGEPNLGNKFTKVAPSKWPQPGIKLASFGMRPDRGARNIRS